MADEADIRAIALALPEAYEDTHRRAPGFRVNARIFGMLRDDPPRLTLKLDREDQINMIEGHPGVVEPGRHYAHHGWTTVWYARAKRELLDTLLRLAWTHVAPRRLSKGPP
jgi:hypothetical protein